MCAVAKILKMADQADDICGYRAFWHCLPPTRFNSLRRLMFCVRVTRTHDSLGQIGPVGTRRFERPGA